MTHRQFMRNAQINLNRLTIARDLGLDLTDENLAIAVAEREQRRIDVTNMLLSTIPEAHIGGTSVFHPNYWPSEGMA